MDKKLLEEIVIKNFKVKEVGESLRFEAHPKPCHRCHEVVEDQRLTIAKKNYQYRENFWEAKCNRCDFKLTANNLTKLRDE